MIGSQHLLAKICSESTNGLKNNMLHIENITDLPSFDLHKKRVLVPTMGALHEGHASLIARARAEAGVDGEVIVSIFVNPTQFDRKEDLDNYPNTLKRDLNVCEKNGTDIVFQPQAYEMYLPDHSISVQEASLSEYLCGATRPGHFSGVCLVLTKLFNLTRATHAIFGKKDFQQLAIVNRLVRDLNIPVNIIGADTVREDSGLAMSSRNLRLTDANKKQAHEVFTALQIAKSRFQNGEHTTSNLLSLIKQHLKQLSVDTKIDYLDLVDGENLQPLDIAVDGSSIAIAVFFGEVRLIDHIEL